METRFCDSVVCDLPSYFKSLDEPASRSSFADPAEAAQRKRGTRGSAWLDLAIRHGELPYSTA